MSQGTSQRTEGELVTLTWRSAFKLGFFGALGAVAAGLLFFLIGLIVYAIFLLLAFHQHS